MRIRPAGETEWVAQRGRRPKTKNSGKRSYKLVKSTALERHKCRAKIFGVLHFMCQNRFCMTPRILRNRREQSCLKLKSALQINGEDYQKVSIMEWSSGEKLTV